jgi:hypothetical protein
MDATIIAQKSGTTEALVEGDELRHGGATTQLT